jgi:DNA-binding beta-propeller fold protein YncE
VKYFSPAGSRTVSLAPFTIPRADGDTLFVPEIEPPPPPTGTQLGYQAFPGGAFMGAFDPQGRFWLTNQKNNRVSVVNENLELLMPEISVGSEPRGLAIASGTGEVWVANHGGHSVTRLLSDGSASGTYNMGFFGMPSGIAVDNQGRAWVASVLWGNVRCFNPDGTQLAGSPFTVGSQPIMVVADPVTGEIWVSNDGSGTITKLNANGSSAGVYFPGVTPGAIALTSKGTLWLVDTAGNQVLHMANNGVLIGDPIPVGAGPAGIAVDPRDDSVWVGIMNGAYVTKLDASGNVIASWPAGTFPGTLTVAPNGEIWVVGGSGVSRLAP